MTRAIFDSPDRVRIIYMDHLIYMDGIAEPVR
jgi:hypothetical protein